MKAYEFFEAVGMIDSQLLEASFILFDAPKSKAIRPFKRKFSHFINSGWGVAMICLMVSTAVLAGMIRAGQHAGEFPNPPGGMESDGSWGVQESVADTSDTQASTEAPTEAATESVLYDPVTKDGLVFVSVGDGTCSVRAEEKALSGKISVPELSPYGDRVTVLEAYAFSDCTGITSLTLPDSVLSIGTGAFRGCVGLASVELPHTLNSLGTAVFQGCSRLSSIVVPGGIVSLPQQTFESCVNLERVEFMEGLEKIGDNAFNGCSCLRIVVLPSSLSYVGNSVFLNCCGLESVYFMGSKAEWETVKIHKVGNDHLLHISVTCLS